MQLGVCCFVVSWLFVVFGGSWFVGCFVFPLFVVSVRGLLYVAGCLWSLCVVGWLSVVV